LLAIGKKLAPEIDRVKNALSQGYENQYASLSLLTDKGYLEKIEQIIALKKNLNPTMLIIVGIGGSNLGTMAIHQALYGPFYNETHPELKVYYADSTDAEYIQHILNAAESQLKQGNAILVNVISKSGTTTETIANFELFLALLIKHAPKNYKEFVVATTDKDSKLWALAEKEGFALLEVPKNVGGRYSVFSAVGLFPLGMIGVNLFELLEGAYAALVTSTSDEIHDNLGALSAALIFASYQNGLIINDTFLFSNSLRNLGDWYRQLMAESLGKEYDLQENKVNVGITPTVSIGTIDLHSVAQLYLGGPRDKFTTFIALNENFEEPKLPNLPSFATLVEAIQGKSLSSIMAAIFGGVQKAYAQADRPFMTVWLPKKNAFYIGQLMQLKMIEMMYLGFLLEVNPFDQPQVELYKKETRALLRG
jgi:glucose-6-phosphate isomerase